VQALQSLCIESDTIVDESEVVMYVKSQCSRISLIPAEMTHDLV